MKRGILLTMLILMLLSPPFVVGQEHASSDRANRSLTCDRSAAGVSASQGDFAAKGGK